MAKFLVLYRIEAEAAEQLANATPEQAQAGMEAWMNWFGTVGEGMVDGGSPVQADGDNVSGYSIIEADSREALDALVENHPHKMVGTLSIHEFLPMPGM